MDHIYELYPSTPEVDPRIPERARGYLTQARETLGSPAGSIMLSASAVDSMLKANGLKEGSLYTRIDQAAERHFITEGMKAWAHQVRIDANFQRHADESEPLPTQQDAKRCFDFAMALGMFLFVLPAMVASGIDESKPADAS
jgi:hypothetical protein